MEYGKNVSGLEAIESIFSDTSQSILKHPEMMAEITSYQAKWKFTTRMSKLTAADKVIAYPNYDSVETIPVLGLSSIMTRQIKIAVENGALPSDTVIDVVVVLLNAIFFGAPIFLKQLPVSQIHEFYQEQLELIWCGIRNRSSR